MKKKEKSNIGGFTANSLVIPLGIAFILLLVGISILTMGVNNSSNELIDMMQNTSAYKEEAMTLQGNIITLSEMSSGFAQTPTVPGEGGSQTLNVGALTAYSQNLGLEKRASSIVENFRSYDISREVRSFIESAAQNSTAMLDKQLHVILLITSIPGYEMPQIPPLATLREALNGMTLTDQEKTMPPEARLGYARSIIFGFEYTQLKAHLNEDIDGCSRVLQEEFVEASTESKEHISVLRTWHWILTGIIIILMAFTFALFYRWLILPLRKYSQQLTSDQSLSRQGGVRELRLMVTAHNELLHRRNKLENILRTAAETDALTGLPNRYSLERYALEIAEGSGPLAVLLFDVNFLKKVNDTKGHLEGDQLLRNAAACIRESFGTGVTDNCYRIGGDEFSAVLRDCTEQDVQARIDRFHWVLEREKISVSVGYGFTEDADENSFKKLMSVADQRMYEQKRKIHGLDGADPAPEA